MPRKIRENSSYRSVNRRAMQQAVEQACRFPYSRALEATGGGATTYYSHALKTR